MKSGSCFCWRRVLFLVLIVAFGRTSATAQRGFFIPLGHRSVDIPFEYRNNFILITLRLNGVLPLKFIFDTGAEHTLITKRELPELLSIQYTREFQVVGSDLKTVLVAYLARDIRLEIPNTIVAPQEDILVLKEDYFRFEEYAGVSVHGILSGNAFSRYLIKIDYQRQMITLIERNSFKTRDYKGFTEVPVKVYRNKPYFETQVRVFGDSLVPARLLLDTGAGLPLMLFVNTHPLLQPPPNALPSNIGMGLGGYLAGFAGRVNRLALGPFEQRNVVTYFQELDTTGQDPGNYNFRNGLIGNALLSHFRVIFDYAGEQIWLQPARTFNDQFVYDRSGMNVIATGDGLSTFLVQAVLPNSPADEVGLRPGDVIVRMGRTPAVLLTLPTLLRTLQGKPGKHVKLTVRRDGQKMKKVVVLRDLL